jgi:hypothetical protein
MQPPHDRKSDLRSGNASIKDLLRIANAKIVEGNFHDAADTYTEIIELASWLRASAERMDERWRREAIGA